MQFLAMHRLTRFYTHASEEVLVQRLGRLLDEFVVPFKIIGNNKFIFQTVDRRKCQLIGEIRIQSIASNQKIVVFQRNKGDPLEYKRFYKEVLRNLNDIVIQE
jgi:serine/threonine-protein kinase Chk1